MYINEFWGPGLVRVRTVTDSIGPHRKRASTVEAVYHRFIHGEVLTHKKPSRSAMSSRAIPVNKMLEDIERYPALPVFWGKNQRGMQAAEELPPDVQWQLCQESLLALTAVLPHVRKMHELGAHKQVANRYLEPWMYMRTILTADEDGWAHMAQLRDHTAAQPEFQVLMGLIVDALNASEPQRLAAGEWHLPYIRPEERSLPIERKLASSAARCARVSFNRHDGAPAPFEDEQRLCMQLRAEPHASPFEHQLQVLGAALPVANFVGYMPQRKLIEGEFRPFHSRLKRKGS